MDETQRAATAAPRAALGPMDGKAGARLRQLH
jgi:hypothetical protein